MRLPLLTLLTCAVLASCATQSDDPILADQYPVTFSVEYGLTVADDTRATAPTSPLLYTIYRDGAIYTTSTTGAGITLPVGSYTIHVCTNQKLNGNNCYDAPHYDSKSTPFTVTTGYNAVTVTCDVVTCHVRYTGVDSKLDTNAGCVTMTHGGTYEVIPPYGLPAFTAIASGRRYVHTAPFLAAHRYSVNLWDQTDENALAVNLNLGEYTSTYEPVTLE